MTRETRVGIAVSCSFLCLVGFVYYLKKHEAPAVEPADTAVAEARTSVEPLTRSGEATHAENAKPEAEKGTLSTETPPVPHPPVRDNGIQRAVGSEGAQAVDGFGASTAPKPLPPITTPEVVVAPPPIPAFTPSPTTPLPPERGTPTEALVKATPPPSLEAPPPPPPSVPDFKTDVKEPSPPLPPTKPDNMKEPSPPLPLAPKVDGLEISAPSLAPKVEKKESSTPPLPPPPKVDGKEFSTPPLPPATVDSGPTPPLTFPNDKGDPKTAPLPSIAPEVKVENKGGPTVGSLPPPVAIGIEPKAPLPPPTTPSPAPSQVIDVKPMPPTPPQTPLPSQVVDVKPMPPGVEPIAPPIQVNREATPPSVVPMPSPTALAPIRVEPKDQHSVFIPATPAPNSAVIRLEPMPETAPPPAAPSPPPAPPTTFTPIATPSPLPTTNFEKTASAPIRVGMTLDAPPVPRTGFEVLTHLVGANDTFASLSKQYYNDERYTRALEEWVKSKLSKTDAMNGSGLIPGTIIVIPRQVDVLKARYAALTQ